VLVEIIVHVELQVRVVGIGDDDVGNHLVEL